jgi:lysophospholipase L1-like esterase
LTVGAKDFTDFIYQLAKKYHVELIDPTSEFMRFSPEDTSLLPDDDHMSRFGNLLLARSVFETLKKYTAHRTYISYEKRPRLFGDLEPNLNKIITHLPALTYALVTNAQGIRVDHPVTFPKQRQRILILGDSFTYGPYLPTTHTFPAQLDRLLPQQEVLSAGVFGYTISDEVELFLERAKYTEPDIVILQVMHNDILGLISYMENIFDRKQRTYSPSALEQKLLTKVRTNSDPI